METREDFLLFGDTGTFSVETGNQGTFRRCTDVTRFVTPRGTPWSNVGSSVHDKSLKTTTTTGREFYEGFRSKVSGRQSDPRVSQRTTSVRCLFVHLCTGSPALPPVTLILPVRGTRYRVPLRRYPSPVSSLSFFLGPFLPENPGTFEVRPGVPSSP